MSYNAFILEDQNTDEEHAFGLHQWMIWVQSPAGAWLLLQGNWPTPTSAKRFIDRTGYTLIETDKGLAQLDKQLGERQREVRPTLHLKSVH
jgi:hypothetical protein